MPRKVRSHLNPHYKPVFVSFRPSQPPPRFYLLVSVSPTDVSLFPILSLLLSLPLPFPSSLFRAFYLLYRLRRGPSVLLCDSFPIVEPARHYIAAPLRYPLPFTPLASPVSRLRSLCYTESSNSCSNCDPLRAR